MILVREVIPRKSAATTRAANATAMIHPAIGGFHARGVQGSLSCRRRRSRSVGDGTRASSFPSGARNPGRGARTWTVEPKARAGRAARQRDLDLPRAVEPNMNLIYIYRGGACGRSR